MRFNALIFFLASVMYPAAYASNDEFISIISFDYGGDEFDGRSVYASYDLVSPEDQQVTFSISQESPDSEDDVKKYYLVGASSSYDSPLALGTFVSRWEDPGDIVIRTLQASVSYGLDVFRFRLEPSFSHYELSEEYFLERLELFRPFRPFLVAFMEQAPDLYTNFSSRTLNLGFNIEMSDLINIKFDYSESTFSGISGNAGTVLFSLSFSPSTQQLAYSLEKNRTSLDLSLDADLVTIGMTISESTSLVDEIISTNIVLYTYWYTFDPITLNFTGGRQQSDGFNVVYYNAGVSYTW